MSAERVAAYAEALLGIARAEGHVEEIEDELFRFARAVEGNDALRSALTDRGLPAERRFAIVSELMGAKALETSTAKTPTYGPKAFGTLSMAWLVAWATSRNAASPTT